MKTPQDDDRTYYEVLEISPDASELDIKKAYRRLALKHHPDRNGGSSESTERFKEIGEAYDCLSDPVKKHDYDASLRQQQYERMHSGFSRPASTNSSPHASSYYGGRASNRVFPMAAYTRRQHDFDAFAQFDRNFGHDPFFQEAFRDMDEEFSRRFQSSKTTTPTNDQARSAATDIQPQPSTKVKSKEGWIPWLLRQCGVEFQMTSYVSNGRGGVTATHYSSSNKSSYNQKQSSVYRDAQGRQVRVQSMERDGNQIEDTYVNNRLVQRKINGIVEPMERIGS
ncbi:molecular chaperone DnaJ [Nitzschia inconspicua]|uniref:Molecular chaperone DnaJ n=1 Tax=Nitzschia inconspicua TaxID=303405 RepID=A0A9K3KX48_9STRA|nr:molecular chaperone DnaJ [Nitzschia inconspicua]